MKRLLFLLCLTLLTFTGRSAESSRPNILLIISDDLSADALGCYGNAQVHTPHIDRLADRGLLFERAYCQFPVCGPSRAALMSGLYPQSVGVTSNGQSGRFGDVMGDRPSLAEHFRNSGWFTARVSKIYHMRVPGDITAGVDGPDHAESWVERYNCTGPEWMTEGRHYHLGNEQLRREPDTHYGLGFGTAFYVVEGPGDGSEQPDVQAADRAIALIGKHKEEPFFLAVGLVRPHVPLVAPEKYYEPYAADNMKLPERYSDDWSDIPQAGISKNSKQIGVAGDHEKQRRILKAYYASVSFMDAQVGRILDALESHRLTEKTLIIFKSDHGYHLGEHDFWQKMSLHEESVRIPLIVAGPGISQDRTRSLAEAIDLYPTLSEWSGLPVPEHCQGVSLMPVMTNPNQSVRDAVYSHHGRGHLIRTDQYAYIRYRDESEEFYDMETDPRQFHNLAESETHSQALSQHRSLLAERLEIIEE